MGMLFECLGSSAPSAMIQVAPFCTPASLSSVESRTPVHWLQLVKPCVSCGVASARNSRVAARAARGAVAVALDEMKAGDEGQALDFVHGKNQGTIDHAVDQQMMFLRVDVGRLEAVRNREVQRGRRDHSHGILKRSPQAERHRFVFQPALRIVDAAVSHGRSTK